MRRFLPDAYDELRLATSMRERWAPYALPGGQTYCCHRDTDTHELHQIQHSSLEYGPRYRVVFRWPRFPRRL